MGLELDGGRQLEKAEVRDVFRAGAHADQLDLRDDEAVAAAVLAHAAMKLRQSGEVEDFAVADFVAHARVPPVKGHDQPNDAAASVARYGVVDVVLVVCNKVRAIFGAFGTHGDMVELTLADLEGCVNFGRVKVSVDGCEGCFGLGLESGLGDDGHGKRGGADVDAEEFVEIGNGFDGLKVEAFPDLEVSDIPPRMHLMASSKYNVELGDEVYRRIGSREILS